MSLICIKGNKQAEHIFIRMVSHEASFWHRGKQQHGKRPIKNVQFFHNELCNYVDQWKKEMLGNLISAVIFILRLELEAVVPESKMKWLRLITK